MLFTKHYYGYKIKDSDMGEVCSKHERKMELIRRIVRKA